MNTLQTWKKGLLPLAVVSFAACGGSIAGPEFFPPLAENEVVFAPSLGIDLEAMERTGLGIFIRDDVLGEGVQAQGSFVVDVNLTVWLPDGTLAGDPEDARWVTGLGAVPPGVDGGVIGMRVGGERLIVVPPALGWGTNPPNSRVPVNSWLVVRAVLLAAVPEDEFQGTARIESTTTSMPLFEDGF